MTKVKVRNKKTGWKFPAARGTSRQRKPIPDTIPFYRPRKTVFSWQSPV